MLDNVTDKEMELIRTLVFSELQNLKNDIDEYYTHDDESFAQLLKRHAKIEMLHKKLRKAEA